MFLTVCWWYTLHRRYVTTSPSSTRLMGGAFSASWRSCERARRRTRFKTSLYSAISCLERQGEERGEGEGKMKEGKGGERGRRGRRGRGDEERGEEEGSQKLEE